jgi:hypothetical protein
MEKRLTMDNLKILIGHSVSPLEMDDEDLEGQQEDASLQYDVLELVDAIGEPDFKEMYISIINNITPLPIPMQRVICQKILTKVNEVYEYEFLPHPELEHQLSMNNVYQLIEFLNYDNISFFGDVWKFLKVDLRNLDLETFCSRNGDKIISEVEEQIESRDLSELITIFLRTYNKDGMINWFRTITEKNRMMIVLKIMEDAEND